MLLAFMLSMTYFTSCSDDTYCWIFRTQTATTIKNKTTYTHSSTTECNLTEEEAESVRKGIERTTTSSSGGVKVTIRITATKEKK